MQLKKSRCQYLKSLNTRIHEKLQQGFLKSILAREKKFHGKQIRLDCAEISSRECLLAPHYSRTKIKGIGIVFMAEIFAE